MAATQVGHLRQRNFSFGRCRLGRLCQIKSRFLHIIYEAASQPLRYHYDPRLMRHVISNLISNGLKYSSTDEHVSVRLQDVGDRITFCVVDQGIGIPDRDLRHLFEPFHRAQNVGTISGTGLGLSIAREAVEMHGGTIEVQSRINEGSTFTVSLPKPRRSE